MLLCAHRRCEFLRHPDTEEYGNYCCKCCYNRSTSQPSKLRHSPTLELGKSKFVPFSVYISIHIYIYDIMYIYMCLFPPTTEMGQESTRPQVEIQFRSVVREAGFQELLEEEASSWTFGTTCQARHPKRGADLMVPCMTSPNWTFLSRSYFVFGQLSATRCGNPTCQPRCSRRFRVDLTSGFCWVLAEKLAG